MIRMPAIFIGHGSPMNAIEDNTWSRSWRELGARLPRPQAVLCVSAHWETRQDVAVSASERPETIHDFYGFPTRLHQQRYPAPGSPALADRIAERLAALTPVLKDRERGLDHGSWCPLLCMFPDAEVPVLQLSLRMGQPGSFHYRLGQELRGLREQGVLLLGSGNIVHNLGVIDFRRDDGYDWADRIDRTAQDLLRGGRYERLIDYERLDPQINLAVPTPEHYWPLLYVLGAQGPDEPVTLFNEGATMGSIAMTSVIVGG